MGWPVPLLLLSLLPCSDIYYKVTAPLADILLVLIVMKDRLGNKRGVAVGFASVAGQTGDAAADVGTIDPAKE